MAKRNVQTHLERETRSLWNDVRSYFESITLSALPLLNYSTRMNIAGFSLSNWMTYGFSFISGSTAWRFPIAFQLVFSVILFATVPWLPESPRWLLAHGHTTEGLAVLAALEGAHATPKDDLVLNQRDVIMEAVRIEREAAPSWRDILHGRTGNTGMIQRLILGGGKFILILTPPCSGITASSS